MKSAPASNKISKSFSRYLPAAILAPTGTPPVIPFKY